MCQIVAFQNIEHLDQHDAAGRRRRHRDDVIAAISAAHRRALDGAIIFEIVGGHDAAGSLHRRGDLLRDVAVIECLRSALRDGRERGGEIGLHEAIAGRQRAAVGPGED